MLPISWVQIVSAPTRLQVARRLVGRLRVAVWIGTLLALGFLFLRFDLVRLPEAGQSPVLEISPGDLMWVDLRPREAELGDLVFFEEGSTERWLLGRVVAAPSDLPENAARQIERGDLWIEGDNPGVELRDSRVLGPIERTRISGRVLLHW